VAGILCLLRVCCSLVRLFYSGIRCGCPAVAYGEFLLLVHHVHLLRVRRRTVLMRSTVPSESLSVNNNLTFSGRYDKNDTLARSEGDP
jgi:hypothetical protein